MSLFVGGPSQVIVKLFFSIVCFSFLYFLYQVLWNSNQPVYSSSVWALFYFSQSVYILLITSSVVYLIPNFSEFVGVTGSVKSANFLTIEGQDLYLLLITPSILILMVHSTWAGPSVTSWFGHLEFSRLQFKATFLLFFIFLSYIFSFSISTHFSSTNIYDFVLVLYNFFFWLWLMFFSNNVLTFIFFLELLSATITLLLVTSTFSSSHFYSNLSFSKHSYFHFSTPTAFLKTLLFFFWITLVSSLLLFLFLIFFYLKFFSFDWNITDLILLHLVSCSSLIELFSLSLTWLILTSCIFLKCGTVPFYFWKPIFFKGLSMHSLFFYVYVYYFSVFMYFIYVVFFYLNEFFISNLYVFVLFTVVATLGISVLLFESFYLKAFLALSSILNSVFIFFALCSSHSFDTLFIL